MGSRLWRPGSLVDLSSELVHLADDFLFDSRVPRRRKPVRVSGESTFVPAFELVAAARRVGGPRAAEDVDYALRLAFFRDSVDVSIEAGVEAALDVAAGLAPALATDQVLDTWRHGNPRADVVADFRQSAVLPIQGSPQIFWPDGTTTHNPGMTDHDWVGGLPRIASTDPRAPARLLAECT